MRWCVDFFTMKKAMCDEAACKLIHFALTVDTVLFQPGFDEVNAALAENPAKRNKMKG